MRLLEALKAIDRPEALALIMRDADAKKILVAWTLAQKPPHYDHDLDQPLKPHELIAEAWKHVPTSEIPIEEISILASVPKPTVKLKVQQLIKAALIYPDGTANEKAMATVRGDIRAYLGGLRVSEKT